MGAYQSYQSIVAAPGSGPVVSRVKSKSRSGTPVATPQQRGHTLVVHMSAPKSLVEKTKKQVEKYINSKPNGFRAKVAVDAGVGGTIPLRGGDACPVNIRAGGPTPSEEQPLWWRTGLFNAIHSNLIGWRHCSLAKNFDNIAKTIGGPTSDSASSSAVILGKTSINLPGACVKKGISMKVTFASEDPDEDDSLQTEERIYREVVPEIINNQYSPHFVAYYATLNCDNFAEQIRILRQQRVLRGQPSVDTKELTQLVAKDMDGNEIANPQEETLSIRQWLSRTYEMIESTGEYDMNRATAIVTEKTDGTVLRKVWASALPQNERWAILFQVIYNLAVMDEIGLEHSDMHSGNIFVDKLDKPVSITYIIDGKNDRAVTVTSKYMVKFFDWDRSTKDSTTYSKRRVTNRAHVEWNWTRPLTRQPIVPDYIAYQPYTQRGSDFMYITSILLGSVESRDETLARGETPLVPADMWNFVRNELWGPYMMRMSDMIDEKGYQYNTFPARMNDRYLRPLLYKEEYIAMKSLTEIAWDTAKYCAHNLSNAKFASVNASAPLIYDYTKRVYALPSAQRALVSSGINIK